MVIGQSFIDTRNESHETDASVVADSFTSESLILTETIDVYPANAPYKRKVSPANVIIFILYMFASFTKYCIALYRKKTSTDDANGPKTQKRLQLQKV
ncbi:transmembrane protein, putative [Medicago truncatula]|uniref:Transmembrane protein, putative n=1 Tax=Medicago truncatula TaxID=3880 RepID=G7JQP5_MEDTR|nr:transmembrane protein, putative [Medicago truncatula]